MGGGVIAQVKSWTSSGVYFCRSHGFVYQ